jgi:hypothetical protein
VRHAADPQDRGRQYLASQLEKLAGTRVASFAFTRQAPAGKWGAATYALKKTGTAEEHRDHRGGIGLMTPMPPMVRTDTPETAMRPQRLKFQ